MQPSCAKLRSRVPSSSAFLVYVESLTSLTSRFCYPQCFVFVVFPRTGNRGSCGTHVRARRRREGWPADQLTQVRCSFHPVQVLHTGQQASGGTPRIPSHTHPRTANPENIEAIIARGNALWNSIYEPHAVKLHDKLASYHPDFICRFPLLPFLG
jgi:hypothetical protein